MKYFFVIHKRHIAIQPSIWYLPRNKKNHKSCTTNPKSNPNISHQTSLVGIAAAATILETTATTVLVLLLLLFLLKRILQHICANGTCNSSASRADESSAGLVSGPGGTTAANEGCSETAFTVWAYGAAWTAGASGTGGILALVRSTGCVVGGRTTGVATVLLGRLGRVAAVVVLVVALLGLGV